MSVVFYISGHGFGHASRSCQLIGAVARRAPGLSLIVRTTVPEWFIRAGLDMPVEIVPGETDTGVLQPDSLSIDEAGTAARAAAFYRTFDTRVAREAAFLRERRAVAVVADIPPVAFAAATAAGIPSVAVSNFTWDWIYSGFPTFDERAPGVRARIASANALASLALRLPFAGGFQGMTNVEDVPLVARRAVLSRHETRARLGIAEERPVVLATFGGHGGNIPLATAADNLAFRLVATDYEAGAATPSHPNLTVVSADAMRQAGVSYTDLLASCDVVATKLGYGIVSECLANRVALLYTLRRDFIEQEVFMREMPVVMRSRRIEPDDLRDGRWAPAVEALLAQPAPTNTVRLDGAEVAAERLMTLVSHD